MERVARCTVRSLAAVALLLDAACPGIRKHLAALTSSAPAATSTPGSSTKKPRSFGVWKGPTPILLREGGPRHEASSVPSTSRGLALPRFQWNDHGQAPSGAFEDHPSGRHRTGR